MSIKSDLLIQATKYNNKEIVKLTLVLFSTLDKLFSSVILILIVVSQISDVAELFDC